MPNSALQRSGLLALLACRPLSARGSGDGMKRLRHALPYALALTFVACQQGGGSAPQAMAPSPASADVSKKIRDLDSEVNALRSRVTALESESAEVSTAGEVYGVARTKFGPFTFVSRGVTPHLDGYKIKLAVGNLTSATFHGAKVKVEYGPPLEKDKFVEYLQSRKEREFNVTTLFSPGAYSIVEITLAPAKPEEVRTIVVGLELNEMSFRR